MTQNWLRRPPKGPTTRVTIQRHRTYPGVCVFDSNHKESQVGAHADIRVTVTIAGRGAVICAAHTGSLFDQTAARPVIRADGVSWKWPDTSEPRVATCVGCGVRRMTGLLGSTRRGYAPAMRSCGWCRDVLLNALQKLDEQRADSIDVEKEVPA